jgi:quercetin dioxygenase-like cupin family protein
MASEWLKDVEAHSAPRLIKQADAPRILWGDDEAGYVNDIINLHSKELVLATICMPPGGFYRASQTHKPIYDATGCFYVMQGDYTVQLPDTGEVRTMTTGQVLILRGPLLHYGYNFGDCETRVLEMISPVPGGNAEVKRRPLPDPVRGVMREALADFPVSGRTASWQLEVTARESALNAVIGVRTPIRLQIFNSSDRLSTAAFDLLAGQRGEAFCFSRESAIYLERGVLNVRDLADGKWSEVMAGDTYFAPAGAKWEIFNHGGITTGGIIAFAGSLADQIA